MMLAKHTLSRGLFFLVTLGLAFMPAAPGQGAEIKDALSGDVAPLGLKLKDLNGDWRRFTASAQSDMDNWMQMVMGAVSPYNNVYFTKGATLMIGDEKYIIAYRVQGKRPDMAALMRGDPRNLPKPEKLTPDSPVTLSLLNLRTLGSMNDIRPFNLDTEIKESEEAAKEAAAPPAEPAAPNLRAASTNNLKQMLVGLLQYAQDYDETLPPMDNPASVKKAILPYIKADAVFISPETKRPYLANPTLSKKKLAQIQNPATMVALYEDKPAADGTRAVGFLDGHVTLYKEQDWPALKKASKIP